MPAFSTDSSGQASSSRSQSHSWQPSRSTACWSRAVAGMRSCTSTTRSSFSRREAHEQPDAGRYVDLRQWQTREHRFELVQADETLAVTRPEPVQCTCDGRFDQVVAGEEAAGAEDAHGLRERVLPAADVVEHDEAEHAVEGLGFEGKRRRVRLSYGRAFPERSKRLAC